jgi:cbb3-type cytochrome oxidase subunit 3
MSPTFQRLFLQIVQPMVFGGLFLVGMMMTRHPLSFLGAGVLVLIFIGSIARAMWKDRQERLENEEYLTLQRQEVNREQQQQEQQEREKEGRVMEKERRAENEIYPLGYPLPGEREEKAGDGEMRAAVAPAPPVAAVVGRGRAYSEDFNESLSDAEFLSESNSNSDLDSVFSRRRLSSTDESLLGVNQLRSPTHARPRGNSVESTGSFPYRMRGSSMDSIDSGEFIWRGVSQQTEFFNGSIISEEGSGEDESKGDIKSARYSVSSESLGEGGSVERRDPTAPESQADDSSGEGL